MSLPDRHLGIERLFPNITNEGYTITSPETKDYNCIAWAGHNADLWWWPDSSLTYFWPKGIVREESIEAFISAYQTIGFSVCDVSDYENGFEKIAIFVDRLGTPTHAARQLDSTTWTSKLGSSFDISHAFDGVSGDGIPKKDYGTPKVFMKRPRRINQQDNDVCE